MLQDRLGPFEVLVEQQGITRNEMELAMKLRCFFPDKLKLKVQYPILLGL